MDDLIKFFVADNILAKALVLQLVVIAIVLWLLKRSCDRELFLHALEQLSALSMDEGCDVQEIFITTAGLMPARDTARLTALIKEKCPCARITMDQDASLWGGLLMRAGARTIDCSLSLKMKQLFGLSAS